MDLRQQYWQQPNLTCGRLGTPSQGSRGSLDVRAAYCHTLKAADNAGVRGAVEPRIQRFSSPTSMAASGPSGAVYTLERVKGGPHASVMRYNLGRL